MNITKKYIILPSAFILMSMGLAGCSTSKSSDESTGKGKGLTGWVQSGQESVSNAAAKVKSAFRKDSAKANDSSGNAADAKGKVDSSANIVEDLNLSGDWAIESVLGKKAIGETTPFLKFVPDEKRVYGNNGCNVINAQYDVNASKGSLSFSNIATTMMLCADSNITDREVGEALASAVSYAIEVTETDMTLTLYNSQKEVVMTLVHRDFHFLDGTWQVVSIDDEKVYIEGMKVALDVDEKRLHGNTGCNIINGELETDIQTPNSISFSKIGMTRMACPNSGWETRMMVALEEAVNAKRISADEIEFIGSNGQQVLLLRRSSAIEE